jgi:hypothetical protein
VCVQPFRKELTEAAKHVHLQFSIRCSAPEVVHCLAAAENSYQQSRRHPKLTRPKYDVRVPFRTSTGDCHAQPAELTNRVNYGPAWSGVLAVAPTAKNSNRAAVNKTFHTFVECYDQSKHDAQMKSYRTKNNAEYRTAKGTQVSPANSNATAPFAYYATHGQMAASIVAQEMHDKWEANTTNSSVFTRGAACALAVQGTLQPNGYYYDVTMWYDVADIYVSFHCYPPKK